MIKNCRRIWWCPVYTGTPCKMMYKLHAILFSFIFESSHVLKQLYIFVFIFNTQNSTILYIYRACFQTLNNVIKHVVTTRNMDNYKTEITTLVSQTVSRFKRFTIKCCKTLDTICLNYLGPSYTQVWIRRII